MKENIDFKSYLDIASKLEITSGEIIEVLPIEKSNKLIQLIVNFGTEKKSVVTNIKPILGDNFKELLEGKVFLFITNLEPVKMMGIDSTAMIMPGQIEKFGITSVNTEPGNLFI